jgi:hypothetical protein
MRIVSVSFFALASLAQAHAQGTAPPAASRDVCNYTIHGHFTRHLGGRESLLARAVPVFVRVRAIALRPEKQIPGDRCGEAR